MRWDNEPHHKRPSDNHGYVAAVKYPGVLAASMRKYVYAVLLLAHTVPLPPISDVEHA